MKQKVSITFFFAGVLFTSCLLISNLISSKIIAVWHWYVPAGVMIFPISYIINDVVAEVWGYRKARLIIWTGFLMNLIAVLFYSLSVSWPAAPFWQNQEAFANVLSSTPRIAVASLLAYLVGSFINAYIMSRVKILTKGRSFSFRAILSTLFGEGADSTIFITIAFAGIIPFNELSTMILTQAVIKTLFEVVLLPLTIYVVKWIKHNDNTDTFDVGISYNPFTLKDL
jgi:queuosine precursor transporter